MTTTSLKTAAGLAVLLMTLGACETLKGAGRDVEEAGEELDERVELQTEDVSAS